jgi:hypothetical protein
MPNPGASPVDLTTPVGALRANLGDFTSVPLNPPVEGQVSYANYSDAALEGFLAVASDSVPRATGMALLQLSAVYAATGRSIRTDDLGLDSKGRGQSLLEVAKSWLAEADKADATAGGGYLDVVSPFGQACCGGGCSRCVRPEATPFPLL